MLLGLPVVFQTLADVALFFPPTESKQDLSMNITANGAASINVSVELNGTVYTGGSRAVFPHFRPFCLVLAPVGS